MREEIMERRSVGQWMAAGLHILMKTTQCAAALTFLPLPSSCRLGRYMTFLLSVRQVFQNDTGSR